MPRILIRDSLSSILAHKPSTASNLLNILGGLFFAKSKNQTLYLDVGEPPSKDFSKNYQSGPLSFEYFLDGLKIITNCGFGSNISSKAELISRLTASQSTLTINDTSITRFERNKLINLLSSTNNIIL